MTATTETTTRYLIVKTGPSYLEYWDGAGGFTSRIGLAYYYATEARAKKALEKQQAKGYMTSDHFSMMTEEEAIRKAFELETIRELRRKAEEEERKKPSHKIRAITVEQLEKKIQADLSYSQEKLAEWGAKFATNPSYALEWADSVFIWAASVEVFTTHLGHLAYGKQHEESEEAILAEFSREVVRQALYRATQNTNKSTGQSKNLMEQARVEVQAKFVEWLLGHR